MSKMNIKTGDTVIVISGKNANGKEPAVGKVIGVSPKEGKVIVEGVHVVSKHVKPRKQGEPGGIIKTEGAIYASKVMLYCPKCQAGRRVRHVISADGERTRVCVKCGETL
ncbi:MAG: 50S ribosomal protein L24 [Clostridiales bacterium]|nr:50S ribosomal protein L24 [Candidatus Coliplasma equi]